MAFVSAERQHIITERGLIDAPDLIAEVVSPGEIFSVSKVDLLVARDGVEPPTRGFSVRCSTN